MRKYLIAVVTLSCLLVQPSGGARAAVGDCEQEMQVVKVRDGNTVEVSCLGEVRPMVVKLDRIDAPEIRQPHGRAAMGRLRALVEGQRVMLCDCNTNTQGVIYGTFYQKTSTGRMKDDSVNEMMLLSGCAWCREDAEGRTDQFDYDMMTKAKDCRQGLWRESRPIPPSAWRKKHAGEFSNLDTSYLSLAKAKEEVVPVGNRLGKGTRWLEHSEARTDSCGDQLRILPCGDFEVENVFTYYMPDGKGNAVSSVGLLVSVKVMVSYAECRGIPSEKNCDAAVRKLVNVGGEVMIDEMLRKVSPIKESARQRFGAKSADVVLYDDQNGKVYLVASACVKERMNTKVGPASDLSQEGLSGVLPIVQKRNEKASAAKKGR